MTYIVTTVCKSESIIYGELKEKHDHYSVRLSWQLYILQDKFTSCATSQEGIKMLYDSMSMLFVMLSSASRKFT